MKLRYKIVLVLLSVFIVWLIAIQFQTYKYPDAEDIGKRLSYLERVISGSLDADSEISLLQSESYEFMLFTYAYSTYALTNISIRDSLYKDRAVALIRESVLRVLDPQIYSPYGIGEPFIHSDTIPDYSVLYLGHLNLMLGCYRLLSGDDSFNRLNDNISESLFRRYKRTPFLNLESYPSAIWIPDNTVAMASLKLHSYNTGSAYDVICKDWVEYAEAHYIDSRTGVLCSTVNPQTGEAAEEPRGSMLGWSIMFIYQFDPDFAIDLYNDYKENFSNELLIFRLFKERYNDSGINMGDIDSGPVFLGYSIPANEFALGGAILAGDYKTARKLERLINFGAATIDENGEIRYKVRFVDMNISPMAEALVLNSLTITKWLKD